jgi:hypothetical protein
MTVPTFVFTPVSFTFVPSGDWRRPMFFHMLWRMTFGAETFEGTFRECFEFITAGWTGIEFTETCVAGVITFTPTGRMTSSIFVESAECSLFFENV